MSVREILTIGHPVLRERARVVSAEELRSPSLQELIDEMIETMRAHHGAGLAANQVGEPVRVAVVEVADNPRYPYKPGIPLTVMVNPELEPIGPDRVMINEGCLSLPDLRAEVERAAEVRVSYTDRDGRPHEETRRGLTAGTFQHEADHLDGRLIVDRADPASLSTWQQFDRFGREDFLRRAAEIVERYGS